MKVDSTQQYSIMLPKWQVFETENHASHNALPVIYDHQAVTKK